MEFLGMPGCPGKDDDFRNKILQARSGHKTWQSNWTSSDTDATAGLAEPTRILENFRQIFDDFWLFSDVWEYVKDFSVSQRESFKNFSIFGTVKNHHNHRGTEVIFDSPKSQLSKAPGAFISMQGAVTQSSTKQ